MDNGGNDSPPSCRWGLPQLLAETVDGSNSSPSCRPSQTTATTAMVSPPVVGGDGQRQLPQSLLMAPSTFLAEMDNVGNGSPSHQQSWTMEVMATTAPPVIFGDRQWRQWLPQLSAETDDGGDGNVGFPSRWRRWTM